MSYIPTIIINHVPMAVEVFKEKNIPQFKLKETILLVSLPAGHLLLIEKLDLHNSYCAQEKFNIFINIEYQYKGTETQSPNTLCIYLHMYIGSEIALVNI